MIRPTPGREAPASRSGQHRSFPTALAAALEQSRDAPAVCGMAMAAASVHAAADSSAAGEPVPAERSARPRRMVLVEGGARDTPGIDEGHLIEVVGEDAAPLWSAHLVGQGGGTRRRLVEHYGSLVQGVAAKLAVRLPASVELADLVQSGTFGLMEAVDRFDPLRAVRFDGYAAQRVRGAMLDELRAQDWVPRSIRARSREIERAREAVALRTGRAPTDRELAAELRVGLRELRHAVRPVHVVSAEVFDQTAGTGLGVADLIVDESVPDPVVVAARRETSRELCAAIAQLGERDRLVLRMYYLENRTLAEIGGLLGVTESRVCQLHGRMVSRLRGRLEATLAG
ncbi:FliA/WhiG family RNA polymerase sigma factor [Pseudonocardia endophytica]|uniref:RNA polymerase sigma factor n=1 Tax=Pseudonocardia endophytica TaxID=401976 RepID=A0A4R1HVG0_PSEEN|nr:FliA/WhiG family RNA polymerase sigma factor [Pseudonocardia endophytica]TCK25421.1 RNA polymerase sigma-28 (SigD/FliA/WhiG) subunit [Pseudonocardia endophytica]